MICRHIAPSVSRSNALAKYAVALARTQSDADTKPSLKRRRLHILYILSDVFHHSIARQRNAHFASSWKDALPSILVLTVGFKNSPKHAAKIDMLLSLWEAADFFDSATTQKLQAIAKGDITSIEPTETAPTSSLKIAKDMPFVLPSVHGSSTTPWYDLPASTWLPHLTPNSTRPMFPHLIQPIQMTAGPADKAVVDAVQQLLRKANRLYNGQDDKDSPDEVTDINELGERIILDAVNGQVIAGETYYGWSRPFCERMKARQNKARGKSIPDTGRPRSRSMSSMSSRSRSRSYSPQRKRRRSISAHRSNPNSPRRRNASPDHTRKRQRSYSRSASRSVSPVRFSNPTKHNVPPLYPSLPTNTQPFQNSWPPPPPPPNWVPDPGMMAQMMAAWGTAGAPPPPPPPVPMQMQHTDRTDRSNHQMGENNRGRGQDRRQGGYRQ